MALTLDASTPSVATQTNNATSTVTTPSFTPPAGALLVIGWAWNTGASATPNSPSITDNRGAGNNLTYGLIGWRARPETAADAQAAMWWARVTTSQAMTITVTAGTNTVLHGGSIYVWVINGALVSGTPVGGVGEGGSASAVTTVTLAYTATAAGSQGFGVLADWAFAGNKTAGTGTTISATGNAGTEISYGFGRRTLADGGSNLVMNTASTNDVMWVVGEVLAEPSAAFIEGPTFVSPGPMFFTPMNPATRPWLGDPSSAAPVVASEVTLIPAVAAFSGTAVTPVPQPVAVALAVASVATQAIALTATPSPVAVTLNPATATLSAPALTATPQPVTVTLTPAQATFTATALGVGSVGAVTLTPATIAATAVALTATPGAVTVTLAPVTAVLSATAVTPTLQPVTVTLAPRAVASTAVPLTATPQAVTVALTPATATLTAVPVSVGGVGAVGLTPASASFSAVPLTVTPQPVTVALTPVARAWVSVTLTATPQPVSVALSPVSVVVSARPLTVAGGVITITLTVAAATFTPVAVIFGEVGVPGTFTGGDAGLHTVTGADHSGQWRGYDAHTPGLTGSDTRGGGITGWATK